MAGEGERPRKPKFNLNYFILNVKGACASLYERRGARASTRRLTPSAQRTDRHPADGTAVPGLADRRGLSIIPFLPAKRGCTVAGFGV